jgi:hypothetical protein
MPTDIKLKNSVTATNTPTSLQQGEVAINVTDRKVWVGNAATTPVQLLGAGATGSFSALSCTTLTASGVATFSAGTVSAPAITTTGDTNTGVFFPAADTIAFTEGGVEAMRIDSSGRVGIGTSSPNVSLQVNGPIKAATANDKGVYSLGESAAAQVINVGIWRGAANDVVTDGVVTTGGNFLNLGGYGGMVFTTGAQNIGSQTEHMRINSSGNVGIGSSSPTAKLNVSGTIHITGAGVFPSTGTGIELVSAAVGGTNSVQAFNRTGSTWQNLEINAAQTIFGSSGSERMRIASNGEIYVGAAASFGNGGKVQIESTATNTLNLKSPSGAYPLVCWNNGGSNLVYFTTTGSGSVGTISTNGTSTAYNTTSDYRLKENIKSMTGALDVIKQLKPVNYNWKSDGSAGQGFIAHELQAIVPDCVTGEKDATRIEQYEITPAITATFDEEGNELSLAVEAVIGEREVPVYQGIDTSFLVATLTAAIQEQQAMIEELKAKVAALEAA